MCMYVCMCERENISHLVTTIIHEHLFLPQVHLCCSVLISAPSKGVPSSPSVGKQTMYVHV